MLYLIAYLFFGAFILAIIAIVMEKDGDDIVFTRGMLFIVAWPVALLMAFVIWVTYKPKRY